MLHFRQGKPEAFTAHVSTRSDVTVQANHQYLDKRIIRQWACRVASGAWAWCVARVWPPWMAPRALAHAGAPILRPRGSSHGLWEARHLRHITQLPGVSPVGACGLGHIPGTTHDVHSLLHSPSPTHLSLTLWFHFFPQSEPSLLSPSRNSFQERSQATKGVAAAAATE